MNILLTSAGRRGYLVRYFKEAIGRDGEIHAANSHSLSTAFAYADKHVVSPLIREASYIPFLLDYCLNHKIKAVIPLYDPDLSVLAANKKSFETIGTTVIVSDPNIVEICHDKWKTYQFLNDNGFDAPKTYISIDQARDDIQRKALDYPLVVKPRFGMGSIGLFIAENDAELGIFVEKLSRYSNEGVVIQEKLTGQEYGLDVINDLKGDYRNTICKIKYSMRAGETDSAETVNHEALKMLGRRLSQRLRHIANLDVDVFVSDQKKYILEMNPRFGGGYPFSHMAGVNLPKAIVSWLKSETSDVELLIEKNGVRSQKDIEMLMIDLPEKEREVL